MIGTLPEYQGHGAGGNLVGWGCDLADKDGLEVYLDSTAWAKRLYEKHGFEAKDSVEIPGGNGYVETFMVRQAKCKKPT
jgi:ribosomal protein S18 acetylase RimI-like enzyme